MTSADYGNNWPREQIENTARQICNVPDIQTKLQDAQQVAKAEFYAVLDRARSGNGLSPYETAVLISCENLRQRAHILQAAQELHEHIYRRRVSLVAPLCPTNYCDNDCQYCPLRASNSKLRRHRSTQQDIQREVTALLDEGYRHVNLVLGNDPQEIKNLTDMVLATYGVRSGRRQIQRVDLNLNPLNFNEIEMLRQAGHLGTVHIYQETYHPSAYAKLHTEGTKQDYAGRLIWADIAIQGGLKELGLGLLLGAGDWQFDTVALVTHALYLSDTYQILPRAISLPRMIQVAEAPASLEAERQVPDDDFCFIVAVIRLALPHVDILLSTPASRDTRIRLYQHGVSQVVVGSASYPGVYSADGDPGAAGALNIGRPRALEDLVYRLCEAGYVPNFCVHCYTTTHDFGELHAQCADERCMANALIALKEYLIDYATSETRALGNDLIEHELDLLPVELQEITQTLMMEAEAGFRGQVV